MIGLLKNIIVGGIGSTVKAVSRSVATFTGDKVQQESNTHDEQSDVIAQLAAEFAPRENRTWFDSMIDGLNRLPRPLLAFEIIALLHWAIFDPVNFAASMQAFALVPEWMALIIGQVILLFFGGRMLNNWSGKMTGPSPEQVQAVLNTQKRIRAMNEPVIDDDAFEAEMKDTSKPLSNAAILEWNRRRHEGR